jgi:sugar/nucleoside kinase (ribokinase family)
MTSPEHIDFLAIGHICHDLTPDGRAVGGTAAYSAAAARNLGCRTAVITSSSAEDDWRTEFPDTVIHRVPSPRTTVFENIYTPEGRVQTIHAVASSITGSDIPPEWQRATLLLLGPIANEVDPDIMYLFSNSLIGLAPQGWLRRWDEQGRISAGDWPSAEKYLRLAAAVFVSEEDITDRRLFDSYCRASRLLIKTQGKNGCTVYFEDEVRQFPAWPGSVVDLTGAGDIFAAAFLIRLYQTDGNPFEAAEFANKIASISIGAAGIGAKMAALSRYLDGS